MKLYNITKEVNVYREEKSPRIFQRLEVREKMWTQQRKSRSSSQWGRTNPGEFEIVEARWRKHFKDGEWSIGQLSDKSSGGRWVGAENWPWVNNMDVTGDLDQRSFRQVCTSFWACVPALLAACLPRAQCSLPFGIRDSLRNLYKYVLFLHIIHTIMYYNFTGSQTP